MYTDGVFFNKKKLSERLIRTELSKVRPPEMQQNIVELGLVQKIQIEGNNVSVEIRLPSTAAPLKDRLSAVCKANLKNLEGVNEVKIDISVESGPAAHSHSHDTPKQKGSARVQIPGVKHMIAVASGKGGVGKSTVAVNLALSLSQMGKRVGLLDADIYGPSIPVMMGVNEKPAQANGKMQPIVRHGIKVMSIGFLVEETKAVVWRGPMVHSALTQFMVQVNWGELDFLIIDMPPGTGDAQLTMSQTAPLSGAVIVTTPQNVSLADARKGLQMFESVQVPVLGIIENMSGYTLPDGTKVDIFRSGGGQTLADESKTTLLGKIPIEPFIAESGDSGEPFVLNSAANGVGKQFSNVAKSLVDSLESQSTFKPVDMSW